jgi:hypothetical protein
MRVRVLAGAGAGCREKPQGFPSHSLLPAHTHHDDDEPTRLVVRPFLPAHTPTGPTHDDQGHHDDDEPMWLVVCPFLQHTPIMTTTSLRGSSSVRSCQHTHPHTTTRATTTTTSLCRSSSVLFCQHTPTMTTTSLVGSSSIRSCQYTPTHDDDEPSRLVVRHFLPAHAHQTTRAI